VRFVIGRDGTVARAAEYGSTIDDESVVDCIVAAFRQLAFPKPEGGLITVVYPLVLYPHGADVPELPPLSVTNPEPFEPERPPVVPVDSVVPPSPYTGRFAEIMTALGARRFSDADALARRWRSESPGELLALIAVGEVAEAAGDQTRAARAYGSLIELFPGRVDIRRTAGERLERLHSDRALSLAVDTYEKALAERPDHASGYRLLAYALVRQRHYRRAFSTLAAALVHANERNRPGVGRVLREDLGLVAAAWSTAEPGRSAEIGTQLSRLGGIRQSAPTLRFVLNWETDANDVDLHVLDALGGHAFYGEPSLPSGGKLYGDVTNGYGPEAFIAPEIRVPDRYHLLANYFSQGPMGFGMGKVQIVAHDGKGGLVIDDRPFIVMTDRATADLGFYSPAFHQ
jgi:tetratricopeptide (TPR) repeat protein